MNTFRKISIASVIIIGLCIALLVWKRQATVVKHSAGELVVYCAAGIKLPVEELAREYEKLFGVQVQLQYGGSGTLLANLSVARTGDLYLAADQGYLDLARSKGLVAEALPLAMLRPVIAVRKGNPLNISTLDDLLQPNLRLALGHAQAASIGKQTKKILEEAGLWERIKNKATVFKPTVTEIANDLKLGAVDAAIIWDATANQYEQIEAVRVPLFDKAVKEVLIGVLNSCRKPAAALHFCRYLAAWDKGAKVFQKYGFQTLEGDIWSDRPRIVLFSGGVNRLAIQQTITEFEAREGVEVATVYNGCGILVAQMKAGQRPDVYFACDVSFMTQVADLFIDTEDVSRTAIVIAVAPGNPQGIHSLKDLARSGLSLGLANAQQSALGALTRTLLERLRIYDEVMFNVRSQTPTADLLVNQLRTGSLDAVIVYRANLSQVRDKVDIIPIDNSLAQAVQPIGLAKQSRFPQLTSRLISAIVSSGSEKRFREAGFEWLGTPQQ